MIKLKIIKFSKLILFRCHLINYKEHKDRNSHIIKTNLFTLSKAVLSKVNIIKTVTGHEWSQLT